MARTQIPVVNVVREGADSGAFTSVTSVDGGYFTPNAGDVELEIVNDSGTAQTCDVVANPDVFSDGLTLNNLTLVVPAGATAGSPYHYGAFRPNTFKQDTDGTTYLNPSTTLLIRAFQREQERN